MGLQRVLPDAVGRGAPDVAVVRLHNVAHHLVVQLLAVREAVYLACQAVVEEETLFGADDDAVGQLAAVGQLSGVQFADVETHDAVELRLPSLRAEVLCLRVEADHAPGRGQPKQALAVGRHAHHPVVAQVSAHAVGVEVVVVVQPAGVGVVDAEAAGKGGDVDVSFLVAGHVVELVAVEGHLQLVAAGEGIIAEETVVGAYPVAALLVAEDELHGLGGFGMGHHTALAVEAVDTHALHGAPDDAVVALADRRDGGAEAYALVLEVPAVELHGPLGYHDETLALATQPEIAVAVAEQRDDAGRAEVDAGRRGVDVLQTVRAHGRNAIETLPARPYIYVTPLGGDGFGEDDVLACNGAHVDVRCRHLAVAIGHDAVLAHDEHLAVHFDDASGVAHGHVELLHLVAVVAVEAVFIVAGPELSHGILVKQEEIAAYLWQ